MTMIVKGAATVLPCPVAEIRRVWTTTTALPTATTAWTMTMTAKAAATILRIMNGAVPLIATEWILTTTIAATRAANPPSAAIHRIITMNLPPTARMVIPIAEAENRKRNITANVVPATLETAGKMRWIVAITTEVGRTPATTYMMNTTNPAAKETAIVRPIRKAATTITAATIFAMALNRVAEAAAGMIAGKIVE